MRGKLRTNIILFLLGILFSNCDSRISSKETICSEYSGQMIIFYSINQIEFNLLVDKQSNPQAFNEEFASLSVCKEKIESAISTDDITVIESHDTCFTISYNNETTRFNRVKTNSHLGMILISLNKEPLIVKGLPDKVDDSKSLAKYQAIIEQYYQTKLFK